MMLLSLLQTSLNGSGRIAKMTQPWLTQLSWNRNPCQRHRCRSSRRFCFSSMMKSRNDVPILGKWVFENREVSSSCETHPHVSSACRLFQGWWACHYTIFVSSLKVNRVRELKKPPVKPETTMTDDVFSPSMNVSMRQVSEEETTLYCHRLSIFTSHVFDEAVHLKQA